MTGIERVPIGGLPATELPGHWGVLARMVRDGPGPLRIQQCAMEPGGGASPHSHDASEQVFVVLEGALIVTGDEGNEVEVRRGEAAVISAGASHGARNEGDETASYLVLTYPAPS